MFDRPFVPGPYSIDYFQVLAVLVCMLVIITKVDVKWDDAFVGYLPSKYVFKSGGLYTCNSASHSYPFKYLR